jgi:hypothetical protein
MSSAALKITSAQCRVARTLLRWDGTELAKRSGVSLATIRRAELKDGPLTMVPLNAAAVRHAFEAVGIVFDEDGINVRLERKPEAGEP